MKPLYETRFSFNDVDAAICAYEWLNSQLEKGNQAINTLWQNNGSCAMRQLAMAAGRISERLWKKTKGRYEDCFDFEFVPDVMSRLNLDALMDEIQYSRAYEPDEKAILSVIMAEYAAREWKSLARMEASKQWGYSDLISDHEDAAEAARAAGETPADFVKALGEKYDLMPAREWRGR